MELRIFWVSVSILCHPEDYPSFLSAYHGTRQVPAQLRNALALKAFTMTAQYDTAISSYFRKQYASADGIDSAPPEDKAAIRENAKQLTLRYGINPHQKPAQAWVSTGKLPFSGRVASFIRWFWYLIDLAKQSYPVHPDTLISSTP